MHQVTQVIDDGYVVKDSEIHGFKNQYFNPPVRSGRWPLARAPAPPA
jgi:hypothetical protein